MFLKALSAFPAVSIKQAAVIGTSADYHIVSTLDALAMLCPQAHIKVLAKGIHGSDVGKGHHDMPWKERYQGHDDEKSFLKRFVQEMDCVILLMNNHFGNGYQVLQADLECWCSDRLLIYDCDGGEGPRSSTCFDPHIVDFGDTFSFPLPELHKKNDPDRCASFENTQNPVIEWRWDGDPHSGFGVISRNITHHLRKEGLHVTEQDIDVPSEGQNIQVIHTSPPSFLKNDGAYKIAFAVAEVNGLPQRWLDGLQHMDEIWTHSDFCASVYRKYAPHCPIHVFPMGIDPVLYDASRVAKRQGQRFIFLSSFVWGGRKGVDVLLSAYQHSFCANDPVGLVLKVSPGPYTVNEIYNTVASYHRKGAAAIKLLVNVHGTDGQMAQMYRHADCFVLPTRGEGLGLPCLEAMAAGLPVICTEGTGCQSYMDPQHAYPIRYQWSPADGVEYPHYRGFHWMEPDVQHLQDTMRHVVKHPTEAATKGHHAAAFVRKYYQWSQAARAMKSRCLEVMSYTI